jgi:hypothetical protein
VIDWLPSQHDPALSYALDDSPEHVAFLNAAK